MAQQHQDVDVVRFLLGLKPEYESVRAQILGSSNLPSFRKVFPRIQRDTLSDHGPALNSERDGDRAAFIAARGGSGSSHGGCVDRGGCGFRGGRTGNCGSCECNHCGRSNHFVEYCWDLHGTPSRLANQVASQADSLATSRPSAQSNLNLEYDLISILKDEYTQFLAHKRALSSSTTTLAQSGIASHCLLSSTSDLWVIDSGANEHMTGSSTSLSDYRSIDTPRSVTLANGSLSQVASSGTTHLSSDIELLFVLHVLGFPFNLLSISKITKTLNCSVSFYPSLCIFQDLKTRRMISMGHEVDGLYYLDLAPTPTSRALQLSASTLQWHCRLRHHSLPTLKHQILSLRPELSVSCEACQLSKQHRVPFSSRVVHKVSSPFELVHSDVWGPINITSNKFHYFVTFVDDFSRMTWLFLMKIKYNTYLQHDHQLSSFDC
jgi:hypothetical protein